MQGTHLVVATDLSDGAAPAARWARDVGALSGHPVCAAHIIEISFASWWKSRYDVLADETKMQAARDRISAWYAEATGAAPAQVELRVNDCHPGLTEITEAVGGALLVMGASSSGALSQVVLGSRVQEMAARPPCPLAIVHPDQPSPKRGAHVVVGVDFSAPCRRAIAFAEALVARIGGRLTLVHAVQVPDLPAMPELFEPATDELLHAAEASLAEVPLQVDGQREVVHGDPSDALRGYVEAHDVDLLVVARTGYRSVVGDVMGSVPRGLISHLPCTLLVVP